MLPERFRGWIFDMANRACVPADYPAAAAIVALSGLIGRRLAIRPKRQDDWLVPPNLWARRSGPRA